VGSLQFQAKTGDYVVEPSVATIDSGRLMIGPERKSSENILLLP
jgi:hypothetical protein